MLLRTLATATPNATVLGPDDREITALIHDSRLAGPGALFVALPPVGGPPDRGIREHVAEAVAAGATAVVAGIEIDAGPATVVRVPDPRAALADLAAQFYGRPSRELRLYAVTGTDGKTTTTYLLEQILARAGFVTGLLGTVETKIGPRRERNLDRMTTPEAPEVQRLLREMVDAGVTHAAIEASSHALALDRLRGCTFAGCALTNITADHVEFHGSWEAYFAAKARLFTELAPDAPAILNRDDAQYDRWAALVRGPVITYGLDRPDVDIQGVDIVPSGARTAFTIETEVQRIRTSVPLPGAFNVSNALAAAGLALTAGTSLDTIGAALDAAVAPPGRMERIDLGQSFEVIVDYAHTENAFRSVLATLRERAGGRLIAVFGATGDRDRGKRPRLGRIAREYADYFVVTNEDPYSERPEAIIAEVASELPDVERGTRFDCEGDRGDAIRRAVDAARPGDTIVILGKGHEQSIVVNGRKEPWSDVAAARAAIEARR